MKTDYVYVMEFDGDKIRHMTKNLALRIGREGARLV